MTEIQIITALARSRSRRNLCCGRYTPANWFECDLAEITPSGYLREYEVKLTRRDFEQDRLKSDGLGNKHQRLANGQREGPCQFWWVTPVGLIGVEEIPPWAGLIHVGQAHTRLFEVELKAAPRLHQAKAKPVVEQHMRTVFYYRYWDALQKAHGRVSPPPHRSRRAEQRPKSSLKIHPIRVSPPPPCRRPKIRVWPTS